MGSHNQDEISSRIQGVMEEIEDIAKQCEVASISIGVLHHGRVLLNQSRGYRNIEENLLADANTTYTIASLSKTFLVAAMGILVDEGKMSWTDLVSRYVPDFDPVHDPDMKNRVDFVDLLRHSSGLLNPIILWLGPGGSVISNRNNFMTMVNEAPVQTGDTAEFQYSNIAYGIAAIAVENITGMAYATFLEQRILEPLKLHRTIVTRSKAEQDDNTAYSYAQQANGKWSKMGNEYTDETNSHVLGCLGMRSCVNDLLQWCAAIMAAEDTSGSTQPDCMKHIEINPLKQISTVRTPYWSFGPRAGRETQSTYCLAWVRAVMPSVDLGWGSFNRLTAYDEESETIRYILGKDSPERVVYKHTGLAPGACCAMFTFPETSSAVIALSNGLSCADSSDFAAQLIIQELFDLQPRIDVKAQIKPEREKRRNDFDLKLVRDWLCNRDVVSHPEIPDDFIGDYKALGLIVSVRRCSRTRKLTVYFAGRENLQTPMEYYNHDIYSFVPTAWNAYQRGGWHEWDYYDLGLLHFRRNEDGSVNGFHWRWDAHQPRVLFLRVPPKIALT